MLDVLEHRTDEHVTRTMFFNNRSIFFKIRSKELPPPLKTWDFAAIAAIFTAMRLGRPLHICGPVSNSLLKNLDDFQETWAVWQPRLYKIVPVSADSEIEVKAPTKQCGVFAFSGGMDSTFSLLRHHSGTMGRRTVAPVTAMMINGFDLDLNNKVAMRNATKSALNILDPLGVPLAIIETNWKTDLCYNWNMEHMTGIAACLAQFHGMLDVAIVAGDEGAEQIDIPWGSNPITNPLLSSDSFKLHTEGAGFTRTQRAGFITQHSGLAKHIRVCWKNAHTGQNCGICEKCIRTQINYRAVGVKPEGFITTAGFWRIATIPSGNWGENYYLEEAQKEASKRGVTGWWRLACYIAIAKNYLLSPLWMIKDTIVDAIRSNEKLYLNAKSLIQKFKKLVNKYD